MGIKLETPLSAVNRYLMEVANILQGAIQMALIKLGEECVVKVRDRSAEESWIDRTGNLRSSIGYAVYDKGLKVMQSTFQQVLGGSEGTSTGQKMIEELAREYSRTLALVVVAGMEYAEYVEAMESKDVLESTRIWAEQTVNSRIQRALDEATAKIERLKL